MTVNGSKQRLLINVGEDESNSDYKPIALLINHSFVEHVNFVNTSTRINDGWNTSIPQSQSFNLDFNGVANFETYEDVNQLGVSLVLLKSYKRDRKLLSFRIETEGVGDVDIFKAYISDINVTSPAGRFVSYSCSLIGYGFPITANRNLFLSSSSIRSSSSIKSSTYNIT